MRTSLVTIALLTLTGCPSPDACPGAPESADVSIEIVAGARENVVAEGGPIAFVRGIQGSDMAVFNVAYASDDLDGCARRTLVVRSADGATLFARANAIELEREGDAWIEPGVQIIEPPPGPLAIEVEAYGTTLERTVVPTPTPAPVAIAGDSAGSVGVPMELTVTFDGPTASELFVEVAIAPEGAATADPPELRLPYGAAEVPLAITPITTGAITVTARTYDFGVYEASTTLTVE